MVEHDRHRRRLDEVLDRRDHGKRGVELHMPAARLHALDCRGEAGAADIGIIDAAGRQIEADASEAVLMHRVERALRRFVVDHRDAARVRAARPHAEQGRGIVGTVNAGGDDHHALDMQRLMQCGHLLGRGRLGRVDAPGEERKLFDIAMDVGVAVAGVRRDVEIDRRRGLRGPGLGSVGHGYSGGEGGKQDTAAVEHGFSPRFVF